MGAAASALLNRFDAGDRRKWIVLAALTLIAAQRTYAKKKAAVEKDPEFRKTLREGNDHELHPILDHPATGWLIENAWLFGFAAFVQEVTPSYVCGATDPDAFRKNFIAFVLQGFLAHEGGLHFKRVLAETVFAHRPWFSARLNHNNADTLMDLTSDFAQCNLPVIFVNAASQAWLIGQASEAMFEYKQSYMGKHKLKLLPYLAKFALGRVVVDLSFYALHRLMHENQWLYDNVHSRHHEHINPRMNTNYHFTALDIWIEAAAPLVAMSLTFDALGVKTTFYEFSVLTTSFFSFEMGSHSGKNVDDTNSWFPLLTPILSALMPSSPLSNDLTLYHTRHHELFKANYSISPWPDYLMGSYKIDAPAWSKQSE